MTSARVDGTSVSQQYFEALFLPGRSYSPSIDTLRLKLLTRKKKSSPLRSNSGVPKGRAC